jgi:hypothetical protein
MGAYIVIYKEKTADEAWAYFEGCPAFLPFRDALQGDCSYKCTVRIYWVIISIGP